MKIIDQMMKLILNNELTNPLEYKELIKGVYKIPPLLNVRNEGLLIMYKDYIENKDKNLKISYLNTIIQISLYYTLKLEPTVVQQLNKATIKTLDDIKDLYSLVINHPKIKAIYDKDEVFRKVIDMLNAQDDKF